MAYLRLSNPTTNSCEYKIQLSSPFNQDYYKQIRITSTDYGQSATNISRYVAYQDAPATGTSQYVRGEINDGMSAGKTYTLHAYAQAANGTWYLAGTDTITTLQDGGKEYDYGMIDLVVDTPEPYNIGDKIKFIATVKNYEKTVGPEYTVELRDWNENLIDSDDEPALEGRTENEVYLYAVLEESQVRDGAIGFYATIKPKESGWTDTSDGDEWYRTKIHISVDGDDGFNTKKTISLDEHITGQIDQDSDDDYYLLKEIPSECKAFLVMVDYDGVPHDGGYDCDIYIYDKNQERMSLTSGVVDGCTFVKVPVTDSSYYIRVNFDGDFISPEKQQYNLSVMDVPVTYLETSTTFNGAPEIHEGMNVWGEIQDSQENIYTITPIADRKLRFVAQPEDGRYDYMLTLMDKNKQILESYNRRLPVTVEYDLKAGEQYFVKVAPDENISIRKSTYLLCIEVADVGGDIKPTLTKKFMMKEDETLRADISGFTCHEYKVKFAADKTVNFYLERTSGDCILMVELHQEGSSNMYLPQLLYDTKRALMTVNVEANVNYILEVKNLNGTGKYFVRCNEKKPEPYLEWIEKLENDTTLGAGKDNIVMAAKGIFNSGTDFDVAFISGLLGNIYYEAEAGKFEDSDYQSSPKPDYLVQADKFGYSTTYSGQNLVSIGLRATKTLIEKCEGTGYAAKFGLGCVQWTGARTKNLIEYYIALYGIDTKLNKEMCYRAETKFMIQELTSDTYNHIYEEWNTNYKGSSKAAYEAGRLICLKYEVPADREAASKKRGDMAQKIYDIFMS